MPPRTGRRLPRSARPRPVTLLFSSLIVAEVLVVGPNAVAGHLKSIGQWLTPLRRRDGLSPVVGDAHGLPILQLSDGHVAVQTPVTVVAGPLDHDDIIELQAPADLQRELGEVALDVGDELAGAHDLAHLRPLAHDVLGQGYAEDVGHPGRAVRLLIGGHSDLVPSMSVRRLEPYECST